MRDTHVPEAAEVPDLLPLVSGFRRTFGPGLVWAATSIGVSHLVQSTRAGAMAGFGLVGVVLVALLLKYPFFDFGARFAAATGRSLVEGYREIGRWALWLFLLITLVSGLVSLPAILLFTAHLSVYALGTGSPLAVAGLLAALCVALLAVGRYRGLDRTIKVVLLFLAVSTVVAAASVLPRADGSTLALWPSGALGTAVPFAFLLALVGWMPSPVDVSVWSSLWTLARDRATGTRATVAAVRRDFLVGYLGTGGLALAFLTLGAAVLHDARIELSDSGAVFATQLVELYGSTLGAWSRPLVLVAAVSTMFSTLLAVMDGFPRALERTARNLLDAGNRGRVGVGAASSGRTTGSGPPDGDGGEGRKAVPARRTEDGEIRVPRVYWGSMLALTAASMLVLAFLARSLTAMVDFATIVAFLTAPILGWLNLRAVRSDAVPARHRPGRAMRGLATVGLALLGGTGLAFLAGGLLPGPVADGPDDAAAARVEAPWHPEARSEATGAEAPPQPGSAEASRNPTGLSRPDTLSREALLRLWARSYHPGRSGDVLLVPRRGDLLTVREPNERFMHGTPWDYDARVPLLLAGGPWIRPGVHPGPASHEDLGATLAALLGMATATGAGEAGGRVLEEALAARNAAGHGGTGQDTAGAGGDGGGRGEGGGGGRRRDGDEGGSGPAGRGAGGVPSRVARPSRAAAAASRPPPPRLLALLVLDGMRPDYLERYADSLPRLRALARRAASFPEARASFLPTATAGAHATLSTGMTPRIHGIVANRLVPSGGAGGRNAFEGGSPRQLLALTLADRWAALTGGRALVAVQGAADYPAAALAGQGACVVGGRRHHVAFFRSRTGRWGTHEPCYRLLPSLDSLDVASLWPTGIPAWPGRRPRNAAELRRTALFARMEGEAVVRTLQALPLGRDSVTDLLLVNLKTLDYVGHRYGPDSPEIAAALAAVDREVGRLLAALDRAAGPEGWVLALTADHGMAGEPPAGRDRHYVRELRERLDRRFDPDGPGIVRFLGAAGLQLYLDGGRLAELGVTVEEVARHLEAWPWMAAAFPYREVLAAQLR